MTLNNPMDLADLKGCTANVLLIKDNTLIVANAGDSRCVFAINKRAFAMSTDHKPHLISEKSRILKAGSNITS